MRGISKPEPPPDVHPEGGARTSLRDAEAASLEELPKAATPGRFARTEFNGLDKRKLRAAMYREQRYLCIYCERRVAEDHPPPRIDHWYPLGANHRLALNWKNLYLSCPKPDTCDSAKADHPFRWGNGDVRMPWPVEFRYEDAVGFTTRGEIYVRSDATVADGVRQALELAIADRTIGARVQPGIVNLNDPALVKARAAAIRGERKRMEKELENGNATSDGREERASQLLGKHRLSEFVSIRVAWLRKTLGKGR